LIALALSVLLTAGKAGEAYLQLTQALDDERAKIEAPETAFYADLLRYLRCAEPWPSPPQEGSWGEARELLAVERMRFLRHQKERRKTGPEAWLAEKRLDWTMRRAAGGATYIVWPAEDERWSDEEDSVKAPAVDCSGKPGKSDLTREAEAVRKLRLTFADPVRTALLLDEAVLRARLGEWSEVWVLVRLLDPKTLRPGEEAEEEMLAALAAEHEDRAADALTRWERALSLPLEKDERRFVDFHRQKLLMAGERWAEARQVLDAYANLHGKLGRYLRYRSALARFQLGDEAALLASARELTGGRQVAEIDADPIARAVEELVYLQLAQHPFSPEQIEVVESLGPPGELYVRMDRLGKVALDRGRPPLAVEIYRWLLEKHHFAYLKPYYLGRLAASASASGDSPAFQSSFQSLLQPPPEKKKAKNIEWDRELLLCVRDAVTYLIARKDFVDLRLLVAGLQEHLRAAPGPYPELTRLYRLASTALPVGPRAYAEKIGAERAPLWLGSVTLARPKEVVAEPDLALPDLDGPVTLLCLPDGKGNCPRWFGPEVPHAN
jgi:hypothetical protein